MKFFRFGLPVACAVALVAMGCGGGSFIDNDRSNGLSGTWVLDSMLVNGTTVTCPGNATLPGFDIGCSRYTVVYTTAGQFTQKSADGTVTTTGTFNNDGQTLTMNYGSQTISSRITVTNNANTFAIVIPNNGYPVTYTFIRQVV
ncbi:lipocalin family protein [Fimbriimonas ginsengisoli]|uniref:Lipocalin-like domain-containing protein n=1 Tax=Fimbriimonas ginsengisoli Gsoil 348 TaxID=661478 RepID=A0A068NMN4_FIMGI|nr:lipocalin family protein [Fimbriimonas ginsengisoli]AIE84020.1 hypothetical protein OP10G_0652 [Fimbriimonas ginsengisoli Gsoil 348]